MIDAAREAVSFTAGTRRAALDADRKLVLAVVKCLEIIGEARRACLTTHGIRFQKCRGRISWACATG
jgi:uncharacterized protein with HEPN domain